MEGWILFRAKSEAHDKEQTRRADGPVPTQPKFNHEVGDTQAFVLIVYAAYKSSPNASRVPEVYD